MIPHQADSIARTCQRGSAAEDPACGSAVDRIHGAQALCRVRRGTGAVGTFHGQGQSLGYASAHYAARCMTGSMSVGGSCSRSLLCLGVEGQTVEHALDGRRKPAVLAGRRLYAVTSEAVGDRLQRLPGRSVTSDAGADFVGQEDRSAELSTGRLLGSEGRLSPVWLRGPRSFVRRLLGGPGRAR